MSQIRLQRETPCSFEAASKAVLQFVAADILEPVGQQNGDARRCIKSSAAAELTVAAGRLLASLLFFVTSPKGRIFLVGFRCLFLLEEMKPCMEYILG